MQPSTLVTPPRIKRLSGFLAWACLAAAAVLPFAVIVFWLCAEAPALAVRSSLPLNAIWPPLQGWQRVAGALVSVVPAGLASVGLWQARRCFAGFAKGELFTRSAVAYLRRFAACMGGSALAGVAAGPILSVLLTWGNPPGLRHLAVSVGSDQLFTLLFAAVVWLMAGVIGQGQALADENASFV
jgi:hypothetical protein